MKPERNKELIEKYQNGLSLREVGEIYNLSKQRVHQILERHGIETRNHTETERIKRLQEEKRIPKRTLQNLYLKQKFSINQIAKQFSISHGCVKAQLVARDIPKRSFQEQMKILHSRLYPKLQKITGEELYSLYVEKNYSGRRVAEFYGCSLQAINARLKKFGIRKRDV
jgi:predicted DNA-binding protein YlxM (UPF0122 family)